MVRLVYCKSGLRRYQHVKLQSRLIGRNIVNLLVGHQRGNHAHDPGRLVGSCTAPEILELLYQVGFELAANYRGT